MLIGDRRIALVINLRNTGVAHLHRDCKELALLPDAALRYWHGQSSLVGDFRLCSRCFPVSMFDHEIVDVPATAWQGEASDRREVA